MGSGPLQPGRQRKQVLVTDASWGIFSPDGSQMAYPSADGIHVMDLAANTEKILPGFGAFNMHWSPDGKQIAYVGMGDGIVDSVFIINVDGTPARQISDFSYESVIGWSPDGKLYFVAPYTGGAPGRYIPMTWPAAQPGTSSPSRMAHQNSLTPMPIP